MTVGPPLFVAGSFYIPAPQICFLPLTIFADLRVHTVQPSFKHRTLERCADRKADEPADYVWCYVIHLPSRAVPGGRGPDIKFVDGTTKFRRQAGKHGAGRMPGALFPHCHGALAFQSQVRGKEGLGHAPRHPKFSNTKVDKCHLLVGSRFVLAPFSGLW